MESKPWLRWYDENVPATIPYPVQPVHAFLEQVSRRFPERTCTAFGDERLTFGEMKALVDRLSAALITLGLERGMRVGMIMPNLPEFVLVYYAILQAGGIVVAVNPQYKSREILFQANDSGISLLFTISSQYEVVKSIQASTGIRQVIVIDENTPCRRFTHPQIGAGLRTPLVGDDLWLAEVLGKHSDQHAQMPDISAEDVAILQYTGGTTGIPKGAIGLHRNLVANTLQFKTWLSRIHEGQETLLMAIPLYHVYGMVLGMNLAIATGSTLVMVPNPRDLAFLLSNLQKYRATIFPGVPSLYAAINRFPDVATGKYDLTSVKACISGSTALPFEVKETFERLTGGKLVEGYGLSEAPTATHCNPVWGVNKTGSIGLPLPDVEARIVDMETGLLPVSPGEVGELVVQGPQVMQGYHNMPGETALALRDGWLFTGDIARMDKDGYFYLVDRKKEVIKVGGFQVWPREVEDVILSHPAVSEAGVAGIIDAQRGEVVKAWVVLRSGELLSEEAVQEWCDRFLAPYKVPAKVEFRSELPRTTVGKILRRELVRQHNELVK
jgi:long-chain acyl-CoA synthetase